MVEVADMVILIKKGHVELDFAKTEFCTNFFFFFIFFLNTTQFLQSSTINLFFKNKVELDFRKSSSI